jgi:hypothetical protein
MNNGAATRNVQSRVYFGCTTSRPSQPQAKSQPQAQRPDTTPPKKG